MDVAGLAGQPGARAGALMDSSDELIAKACSGDEEAFRLIFERYARPILSFIYDMVDRRELAEELAQETFVRAFRGLDALKSSAKLSTWLFGIARNVALEALRSRRKEAGQRRLDETEVLEMNDRRASPVDQLLDKELQSVMRRALAALDEDKRLVFTLKVFQQRSYEEIAEITGFSIAKLKTDLHRARIEMRRRLSPYLGVSHEV